MKIHKGSVIAYGGILALLILTTAVFIYMTSVQGVDRTVVTQEGDMIAFVNDAELLAKSYEQGLEFIFQKAAYDLGLRGGQESMVYWTEEYPSEKTLKLALERKITENLPENNVYSDNDVTFGEKSVGIIAYDSAQCDSDSYPRCFLVSGNETITVSNEELKAAVSMDPYEFNVKVSSNYFRLIKAARAIVEDEKYSGHLADPGYIISAAKSDERFYRLTIKAKAHGDYVEFTLYDSSCMLDGNYYCIAPLRAGETGSAFFDDNYIPYGYVKMVFRVMVSGAVDPPESDKLSYTFSVAAGSGKIKIMIPDQPTVYVEDTKTLSIERGEIVKISIPSDYLDTFRKIEGTWNGITETLSQSDWVPPGSPESFEAAYDGATIKAYFSYCGDGTADKNEDCDKSDLSGQTCETKGFLKGTLSCGSDCKFNTAGCSNCGNGQINGVEECDNSNLNGKTCLSEGFASGSLSCNGDCTLNTKGCSMCGNGHIDAVNEKCDGSDLGGKTCISLGQGFTGGTLSCSSSCTLVTSACTKTVTPPVTCTPDCTKGALPVCTGSTLKTCEDTDSTSKECYKWVSKTCNFGCENARECWAGIRCVDPITDKVATAECKSCNWNDCGTGEGGESVTNKECYTEERGVTDSIPSGGILRTPKCTCRTSSDAYGIIILFPYANCNSCIGACAGIFGGPRECNCFGGIESCTGDTRGCWAVHCTPSDKCTYR